MTCRSIVNKQIDMDPQNGFISTVWGPALWMVIHCISLNYPLVPTQIDKQRYRAWFEGLQHVLPCGTCRTNFKQNLVDIGYDPQIHFQSRLQFANMVFELHNAIRVLQCKPVTMTFAQCVLTYEQFRAKDCTENTAAGEGGCFGRKPVSCTLRIVPQLGPNTASRFEVDPACDLHV